MTLALSLEAVLTGAGFMDVPASPLQLAIARAAYGESLRGVIDPDTYERHFGCDYEPRERPRRVVLVCGVRGGKSTIGVAHAITSCLTASLSHLKAHEIPRYVIVGPTVDAAEATFRLLVGYLQASPVLRSFLKGEPTANTVMIRRPDSRCVEIVVVAAHRGGLSVRNRWLVGCTVEELSLFGSEATGAIVNAEELLRAAETRLLPGCQAWLISSPAGPVGLLYDLYRKHFGKPGATLVVHAPTRALNPSFPQSTIDEIRADDPDTAAREYDAAWVDADSAFLPAVLVDSAVRKEPLIRAGRALVAAMDPATRGNSWTLAVAWTEKPPLAPRTVWERPEPQPRERLIIGGVWQWTGSKQNPLRPFDTLKEIAKILRPYGVRTIRTDGWSLDALADHARMLGLRLEQHTGDRDAPYTTLRTSLANGLVELPPDPTLRRDLVAIRQRATASGVKLHLQKTPDGRHCDYAPSVALAAHYATPGSRFQNPRFVHVTGL